MSHTSKTLEKSQVELTITVAPADFQKNLEQAAVRLSERAAIKGFRPGKAPYDMVKQQLGEIKIMEEALESIVQHAFVEAMKTEKLETIGAPKISIEKMAPGNDLVFKAVVALVPQVKLADLAKIKVKKEVKTPGDKEVNEVMDNLRKMQPKEIIKNGTADKEDKIVVDMDMFIDKVPVEGGQAKAYQIYLNEPHYIPGMAEQLLGLKKDDTKEFNLPFPKEHYQKHLAGRNVDFKITVKDVFTLEYPQINDEFAKTLGQESLQKLKELLLANLTKEAQSKEEQRLQIAILDQLIEQSEFDVIPDVLIDSEKHKMFHELKHDLDHRGITIEQYLKDLKKTEEQIFADFETGAQKRAKAALISRQVAKENDIKVEKKDLDEEVELIKKTYAGDKQVEENLKHPEVLDTIAATIQNRKVMKWLKEKIVK